MFKRPQTPEARMTKNPKQGASKVAVKEITTQEYLGRMLEDDFLKQQNPFFTDEHEEPEEVFISDYVNLKKLDLQAKPEAALKAIVSHSDKIPEPLNLNISLANPQQIFNILQMEYDRTCFVDLRHSVLQRKSSLPNSFPMPVDKLPEPKVLRRNIEKIGSYLGWDKKLIAKWHNRSMFYLIFIASSLSLGPVLEAYAYCMTSDLETIIQKMQCQNSEIYPYSPPAKKFYAREESKSKTRVIRFEPEEQDPDQVEEQKEVQCKQLNMRKVDQEGLYTAFYLFDILTKDSFQECFLAVDGYQKLQNHYQFLCLQRTKELYKRPKCGFPNEILCQKLYLGDREHAQNFEVLKYLGITHILNVRWTKTEGIKYQKINISDESSTQIKLEFPLAYEFINRALETPGDFRMSKKSKFTGHYYDYILKRRAQMQFSNCSQWNLSVIDGIIDIECQLTGSKYFNETYFDDYHFKGKSLETSGRIIEFEVDQKVKSLVKFNGPWANECKVLVHCHRGVSRSATIVIMYLMRKFKLTLRDAYKLAKSRRDKIDPNAGFIQQLIELEKSLSL